MRGTRIRMAPAALALACGALAAACGAGQAASRVGPKVIVLGFDGMDYDLVREAMAEGRLPNLSRLAAQGTFQPLATSMPPQSPVAWSNFITGMDAGGHGIFDFIHRDPKTMIPFLSTSRTEGSERNFKIGRYQFPLSGAKVELLRRGTSFWEVLEEHGVRTAILRIPANFPPTGTAAFELSGMGTPDILGTYGTFSYYTTDPGAFAGKKVSGGKIYPVIASDNTIRGTLVGPKNPFLIKPEKVVAEFTVHLDPEEAAARLVVGDHEQVLEEGEWSDWVPVTFDLVPTQKLRAIARFYLKRVRPTFALYVSPLNLDPMAPAMPISTPAGYAREIAEATGYFYTQGMPEDTKADSEGVLSPAEFLEQARLAGEDVLRQYPWVLENFDGGLLFYYFGNADQISHMMWRPMDEGHPAYDTGSDAPFRDVVKKVYESLDPVVGQTQARMGPDSLLVVMSDHGFTSWRREFHLNAWLRDNGYLAVLDPNRREDPGLFANVDWTRTRAYGLGLNGLYVNLAGREKWGIVPPEQRQALMDEIERKLRETIDPATGRPAVTKVFQCERDYKDRGALEIAPDMIVGTAKGTRTSNESALGSVPPAVFSDNAEQWSGDHCMDPDAVPGVLFTSRPLKRPAPALKDLGASILAEFGIQGFPPGK